MLGHHFMHGLLVATASHDATYGFENVPEMKQQGTPLVCIFHLFISLRTADTRLRTATGRSMTSLVPPNCPLSCGPKAIARLSPQCSAHSDRPYAKSPTGRESQRAANKPDPIADW